MSETKPPEENGSWLRWAIAQIDFTDLIAVASSPEPLTGLQVANACIEELKAHEAKAAAYDELIRKLWELPELNTSNYDHEQVVQLNTGVNNLITAEIAANRFAP